MIPIKLIDFNTAVKLKLTENKNITSGAGSSDFIYTVSGNGNEIELITRDTADMEDNNEIIYKKD